MLHRVEECFRSRGKRTSPRPIWGLLLVVFALILPVGSSAAQVGAPLRPSGRPTVRTVATVRGRVVGFAQDRRYLAWTLPGKRDRLGEEGCGMVIVKNLGTGARTRLAASLGPACSWGGYDPLGLALAGGRAYWEQIDISNNTFGAELASASVRDRKLRGLGSQEVDRWRTSDQLPSDQLLPPVSDGSSVYFWSSTEPDFVGPILSFRGRRRAQFIRSPSDAPDAVAAGGGRFARAIRVYDNASSPAWAPDGNQIAYSHGDELWLVNADGTNPHRIAARGLDPDWSPDGAKLAYGGPANTVVIANADGTNPKGVTNGSDPAWSPDGSHLAIVHQGGIWIVAPDGSDLRLVIPNAVGPDWSPDGSQLVFARGEYATEVHVANADGSNERTLVANNLATASPSWSPDGSEIAFTCSCEPDPNVENVCEIRPDGSGEHCLATGANDFISRYQPAWGPTPGRLVFVKFDPIAGDGDSHLVLWPGMRQLTYRKPPPTPIIVYAHNGRAIEQTEAGGRVIALAVSSHVAAALVREPSGGRALEIYQPQPRVIPIAHAPQDELALAGTILAFQVGRTIEVVEALEGSPRPVATTPSRAIGLSLVGHRLAWAENVRQNGARRGRIRVLELRR
jgi:hypothetical protein